MFKHGFPPEWSTLKKLIWLVGSGIARASYIWKTVTGTLIHLTDALASPMQKCEVTLEPIQDLSHGDPSPENICPITGWTGCEVTRTGENMLNKADMKNSESAPRFAKFGVDNYNDTFPNGSLMLDVGNYVFSLSGPNSTNAESISVYDDTNTRIKIVYNNKICSFTTTKAGAYYIYFVISSGIFVSWDNYDIQLERGTTPTDYEAPNITTISVTFPDGQTVYGGTVDLVSGLLTVDRYFVDKTKWTQYASSNGYKAYRMDNLPRGRYRTDRQNEPMSNMISEFGSFSSASMIKNIIQPPRDNSASSFMALQEDIDAKTVELCYLIEPIEIQLTPQEISTLRGENNVWSNSNGDTTIIYKAQA